MRRFFPMVLSNFIGKVALITAVLMFVIAAPVAANPIFQMPEPHPGAVVHLDTGVKNLAAFPGPGNTWSTVFTDGLYALLNPWHWETELNNPRATAITGVAGWYWPQMGVSQAVQVTLQPGASLYAHFCLAESPEVGNHLYNMGNYDPTGPVCMHATIQECPEWEEDVFEVYGGGGGEYELLTGIEPEDCDFLHEIPEPSTVALLAAGAVGLLGWTWRRKRPM